MCRCRTSGGRVSDPDIASIVRCLQMPGMWRSRCITETLAYSSKQWASDHHRSCLLSRTSVRGISPYDVKSAKLRNPSFPLISSWPFPYPNPNPKRRRPPRLTTDLGRDDRPSGEQGDENLTKHTTISCVLLRSSAKAYTMYLPMSSGKTYSAIESSTTHEH